MATEVLSDISGALSTIFDPRLVTAWNRNATLASKLRVVQGFGSALNWGVQFSGAGAGIVTEGSDVAAGELLNDAQKKATLAYAIYRTAFGLTDFEESVASTSMGSPTALNDMFMNHLSSCAAKLSSTINSELYTGSTGIIGLLGGAVAAGTTTYAGLARGTYSEWKSTVMSNSGTPRTLTMDMLEQMDGYIRTASNTSANVILCGNQTYRRYKGLFETNRAIAVPTMASVANIPSSVFFNGAELVRDRDCPDGYMIFVDTEELELVHLPKPASTFDALVTPAGESVGLPFALSSIARAGSSRKFFLEAQLQLKVRNPNHFGVISDLSY